MWGRLKRIGRNIAASVAMATALAGLAILLAPLVPGAGFSSRYALVGIYLIWSGVLIARETFDWKLDSDRLIVDLAAGWLLGDVALMGSGFISAALVLKAAANSWAYGLAAPAAVALVYAFTGSKKETPEETPAETSDEEIEPETGKLNRGAYLWASLWQALLSAAGYLYLIAAIGFGTVLWVLLDQCLYEGGLDWAGTFAYVAGAAGRLAPMLVVMPAVIAVLMFVFGLVAMAFHWLSLAGRGDANRDLTPREIDFIETSAEAVRAYSEAKGYAMGDWRAIAIVTALYLILGGAGAFALYHGFFPAGTPKPVPGLPLYLPPKTGPSAMLMVFTLCAMIPLPSYLLSAVWRRYSEYSTWRGLVGKTSEYATLTGRLTNFVRTRRLDPHRPIDAGDFLHRAGQSLGRLTLLPLLPLMALTGWFFWLDVHNDDSVSQEGLTVVHYWTGKHVTYPWSAVRGLELECTYGKNDRLEFGYFILLPDGFEIDATEGLFRARQFAALAAIDAKLADQGVPISFETRKPLWQDVRWAYSPRCVRDLAADFSGDDAKRILSVFHIADWERRREK